MRGFNFVGSMAERVTFFIDGFNMYHSISDAIYRKKIWSGKWLNLHSLCNSFVKDFSPNGSIESVHYFSAFANHVADKGAPARHQIYLKALEDTGVEVTMGKFKPKYPKCSSCKTKYKAHEEKESDVNIAIKLLEKLYADSCDWAVIVSGDSDLTTVIRNGKRLFPKKKVGVLFPYARANAEFIGIADTTADISPQDYYKNQFANPYKLRSGMDLVKPPAW